jgi:aspartate aminotransferase
VSYYDQVLLAGGKPVIVEATIDDDFKISPDQLEAAITAKTRIIIFNSPSNPTGMVYSGDELEAIAG